MNKILLVEDDEIISKSIKQYLENWDFEVKQARDFKNITNEFNKCNAHIVLLDLILPFYDGFYWCKEIRKISNVPIVFLSSASDNMNIVMAVNMGGDDFIAKPFDLQVLVAKIQAMLRRTYDFSGKTDLLTHKEVQFNINDNIVTYQGKSVELTKNEGKILRLLMEKKETIVPREELMEYLWKTDYYVDENALSVNVNRVRKKLERIGVKDLIQTRKGIGYIV